MSRAALDAPVTRKDPSEVARPLRRERTFRDHLRVETSVNQILIQIPTPLPTRGYPGEQNERISKRVSMAIMQCAQRTARPSKPYTPFSKGFILFAWMTSCGLTSMSTGEESFNPAEAESELEE